MIRIYSAGYKCFTGLTLQQVQLMYPGCDVLPDSTSNTKTGVVVTTGSHCVGKIDCNDPIIAEDLFQRLTARYPGLVVTLHDSASADFQNEVVDQPGLIEVN